MIVPVPYFVGSFGFGLAVDELLAHAAIRDELLDRDDRQIDTAGRARAAARGSPDRPMSFEDFAQHAGGQQAGHARQVDGRFGVSGAAEHAAFLGHERKQVAGPNEVGRLARRVANRPDRRRPFGRRDAGPRRAVIDGHRVIRAQRRGVRLDHRVELEPLADLGQDRHAELPAALGDHEVDRLGRRLFGGADEVAFVFAVLGVDDNDDPALADRVDGFFNRGKWVLHVVTFAGLNAHCGANAPS